MKNAVMKDNVNSTSTDTEGELEGAAAVGVSSDEVQLKKQARRRLIGAIALALFGVIVLPMVMDSQPRPVAPEIQVHIPSQDGPGFTGKIVPGAVVKPTPMPPASPAVATTAVSKSETPAAKETASAPPNAPSSAASSTNPSATETSAPVAAKVVEVKKPAEASPSKAQSAVVAKPKSSTAKAAEPVKKPAEPAVAGSKTTDEPRALAALTGTESLSAPWFVQLGAYKDAGNVKTLLAKVKEMKIAVSTEKIESSAGPRIRVRAGPFATRAEAEKAQTRILTIKVNGVLSQ